jgi:two-component system, LytTR family, sensor kinase
MESEAELPNKGHLDTRLVLLSILGFWLFYFVIVTLRTWVLDYPSQGEMSARRAVVTSMGVAVTILQWIAIRPFDGRSLGVRIITAAVLAMPCALAITVFNYYVFNIYDPAAMMDVENLKPPHEFQPSAITQIAELAIGRYFFLIAWAAVYLAMGFSGDVRIAERRAAEFARAAQTAELRALRYQVNPHFLFNTLNSLSALVMRGRRDEAEAMIMNLSTFYRTSLSGEPSEDVPLADEIALQRLYLDIEIVRFPERLRVEIDVPEAAENAAVPGLILQPLVENAVKHGVSRTASPVTIAISARQEAGMLVVEVSNSAAGKVGDGKNEGHGIGLANVRDRLAARFGGEARLEAGPDAAGGWRAVIALPRVRA